jgi:hypothetical protein
LQVGFKCFEAKDKVDILGIFLVKQKPDKEPTNPDREKFILHVGVVQLVFTMRAKRK